MPNKIRCSPENAVRFMDWISNRGGIAVWNSVDLSNPSTQWFTPAFNVGTGDATLKPTWQAEGTPSRVVTNIADVVVIVAKEVKRFYVAIRPSNGFAMKVTDGGSRRISRTIDKLGDRAWYEFDYSTQEAVFYLPDKEIPLDRYVLALEGS